MKAKAFFVLLLFATLFSVWSQDGEKNLPSQEKKALVEKTSLLSDQKRYAEAIEILEEALLRYPENTFLTQLLKSVKKLQKLEQGNIEESEQTENPENYNDLENPDFKVTSREEDSIKDPLRHRNSFAITVTHSLFTNYYKDPFIPYNYQEKNHTVFRSSVDFNYFFSFLKKLIGFQAGYEGVFFSFRNNDVRGIASHQVHLGILLRTILFEEPESSLIFTINGGAGLLFNRPYDVETSTEISHIKLWPYIYISLHLEDPLLYHLFQWKKMQRFILFGGIKFNYAFKSNSTDGYGFGTYSIGMKLRFSNFIPAASVTFEDDDFSDWQSVNWGINLSLEVRF